MPPTAMAAPRPRSRAASWALLLPSAAVMSASAALLYRFTAEDAYIVARYAENLVRHGVLHYNVGEPINALTSPFHGLFAAALFALTGATVTAYKVVGLACFLAAAALVLRATRAHRRAQAAAFAVLAAPCLVLWAFGGLETPLLLLEATGLAALSYRDGPPSRRALYLAGALAGLAVLTRYDAVLFAGPAALALFVRAADRRHAVGAALLGATLVAAWLAFAWSYFGDVLPTSYYIKTPSASRWQLNGSYVLQYLAFVGVLPLAALAMLGRKEGRGEPAPVWRLAGVYLGLVLMLGYALTAATTHMMFGFRLVVPYVPALALGVADLLVRRWPANSQAGRTREGIFTACVLAMAAFQAFQLWVTLDRSLNGLARGPRPTWPDSGWVREGALEYQQEGARAYVDGFLATLAQQTEDVRAHWTARNEGRPPRIFTYAGGVPSYTYPEAYVFEVLVSHRRGCDYPYSTALSADYIQLLTPRQGSAEQLLPFDPARYELVSSYTVQFDGQPERFLVYYNPRPLPNPLPPRLHDACPPEAETARALIAAR